MMRRRAWVALLAVPFLTGFDLSRHGVPPGEILSGGPPKDGIPALVDPTFVAAGETSLRPEDRVVGVVRGAQVKAYPIRILDWHEAVNDVVGDTRVAVTYCPLTASAVVYDRRVQETSVTFGISGRLYQSNVLLYDHQTDSLWSQLRAEAVAGPRTGAKLDAIPSVVTTWADWRSAHPDTLVLSFETGHQRDYARAPYASYRQSPHLMFPVSHRDARLGAKEEVFGLIVGDGVKAYRLTALASVGHLEDEVGGRRIRIDYASGPNRVQAVAQDSGQPIPGVVAYWFAWAAFHPDTALWGADGSTRARRRAPKPPPPGIAIGSAEVTIVEHRAYWTDLFGIGQSGVGAADSGDAPGLLVIAGQVRNEGRRALQGVELAFELLDTSGDVVAAETGYNRAGEQLRPLESPFSYERPNAPSITPIPASESDSFRMILLASDLPAFTSYRVSVRAVKAERPVP